VLAESDPRTTLLVVLGASDFPRGKLRSSKAFKHASNSVCFYFLSNIGFGLPIENLFGFFNSEYDQNTLDDEITTRLKTRVQQLQAAGMAATDLIVYYVGHGSFDEQKRYYLALRSTREENQSVSSLRIESLMTTLNNVGHALRKYVIIDACFAGEAAFSQSGIEDAVGQQIRRLPQKGTTFLCSSARDHISEFLPDESTTIFTEALSWSLWEGRHGLPPKLSFEHLHTIIEDKLIESSERFIRPLILTPVQPEGDIAKVAIFPNGPRRTASLEAEREHEKRIDAYLCNQADEQARRAARISAEKKARDEEIRQQQLAEQKREQTRQAGTKMLRLRNRETLP
jgi:Caspase domain